MPDDDDAGCGTDAGGDAGDGEEAAAAPCDPFPPFPDDDEEEEEEDEDFPLLPLTVTCNWVGEWDEAEDEVDELEFEDADLVNRSAFIASIS